MSSPLDRAVRDLAQAIQESKSNKTKAYDTQAEVIRVEDGIAWVHIPGGVEETPVSLTVNAKAGDQVQVRVGGGQAWMVGNASNPPTDDTKAIEAATQAEEAAAQATKSAMEAKETTDEINAYAETAGKTVTQILDDGETAGAAAQQAKTAADNAMLSLSNVQDVVGVLEWITNHGTMTSQVGETFDENNIYFIIDPNGDYVIGSTHYSLVAEPKAEDIDTYYCMSVDKSIQNYVATHIVVDSEGLWIIPDSGDNKILIATGGIGKTYETAGTYIIVKENNADVVLARFGASIVVGKEAAGQFRTVIANQELALTDGTKSVKLNSNGFEFWTYFDTKAFSLDSSKMEFSPYLGAGGFFVRETNDGDQYPVSMMLSGAGGNDAKISTATARKASFAMGGGKISSDGKTLVKGTSATGEHSFAQGFCATAEGDYSNSHGYNVDAGYEAQTVIGKHNSNQSSNAFEIGNGASDIARSNAFEVDWSGNVNASGDVEDGSGNVLANKVDSSALLDWVYPVGKYVWTSDANWDPNTQLGGTWELMDEGLTLVSAGQTYTVQSGTAKDGGNDEITLTDKQMAHGHTYTRPTVVSGEGGHTHTVNMKYTSNATPTGTRQSQPRANGTSTSSGFASIPANSGTHNHTLTGGGVANLAGASSTREAFDNMPPYKAAYCWHRTA